jgi:hydroxymethylpyrimidine pyrophosphatase-like HAD family hydrolase
LNDRKEVSGYTQNAINALISGGGHFTVATARTSASVVKLLSGMDIDIPVILMNGVVIYDIRAEKYIRTEALTAETSGHIAGILEENGRKGFMYAVEDGVLKTYYEELDTQALKGFHDERMISYGKKFCRTGRFGDVINNGSIIYFVLYDTRERLDGIYKIFSRRDDINTLIYKDIYTADLWYMELYSRQASKRAALGHIRSRYGFNRIIGFGDNINDIPLREECDEFYAVSNAVGPLREVATGVIGDNNSDSVARYIVEKEGLLQDGMMKGGDHGRQPEG